MLPKRQETTDSFNNSNSAAEILCNVICLAKRFLISHPGKGFAEPVNYGTRDPVPPGPGQGWLLYPFLTRSLCPPLPPPWGPFPAEVGFVKLASFPKKLASDF